jgi:hypothetical protein
MAYPVALILPETIDGMIEASAIEPADAVHPQRGIHHRHPVGPHPAGAYPMDVGLHRPVRVLPQCLVRAEQAPPTPPEVNPRGGGATAG